jgi:hypothetical protein
MGLNSHIYNYEHDWVCAKIIFEGGYEEVNPGLVIKTYLHQYILFRGYKSIYLLYRCPLYRLKEARLATEKAVKFY